LEEIQALKGDKQKFVAKLIYKKTSEFKIVTASFKIKEFAK